MRSIDQFNQSYACLEPVQSRFKKVSAYQLLLKFFDYCRVWIRDHACVRRLRPSEEELNCPPNLGQATSKVKEIAECSRGLVFHLSDEPFCPIICYRIKCLNFLRLVCQEYFTSGTPSPLSQLTLLVPTQGLPLLLSASRGGTESSTSFQRLNDYIDELFIDYQCQTFILQQGLRQSRDKFFYLSTKLIVVTIESKLLSLLTQH